ncbi:MAG: hypothetical protein M1826_004919 [Phylliscum demangeonii]|nr:MAG: hypothetical protein M1826_004919 [Phylliscum demangeonii]
MLDTLHPTDVFTMSRFPAGGDWVPTCTVRARDSGRPWTVGARGREPGIGLTMGQASYNSGSLAAEDPFAAVDFSFIDPSLGYGVSAAPPSAPFYLTDGHVLPSHPVPDRSQAADGFPFVASSARSTSAPAQIYLPALADPTASSSAMLADGLPLDAPLSRRKRKGGLELGLDSAGPKRIRKCLGPIEGLDLNEDERRLLELREHLPQWKDIAREYGHQTGKEVKVPALQMKLKRLHERLRSWTDDEVLALRKAYDAWEKSKWEIISSKMMDFGCPEKWPPKYCQRKWLELSPESDPSSDYLASMNAWDDSDPGSPDLSLSPEGTPAATPARTPSRVSLSAP